MDKTRSYKAFFYFAGTPLMIGFILLFALRCLKDFKPSISIDELSKRLNEDEESNMVTKDKEKLVLLQLESAV